MEQSTASHYLIKVKCTGNKDEHFSNGWYYLSWSNEGGGWASHSFSEQQAKQFKEIPSLHEIRSYSGFPWYNKHDLRTKPEIIKVTTLITKEIVS